MNKSTLLIACFLLLSAKGFAAETQKVALNCCDSGCPMNHQVAAPKVEETKKEPAKVEPSHIRERIGHGKY